MAWTFMRNPAAISAASLLVLLALAAAVAGQSAPAVHGTRVVTDPAGDVKRSSPAGDLPTAGNEVAFQDILAVDFQEIADGFEVSVAVAAFPPAQEIPSADTVLHDVGFTYEGANYIVQFLHGVVIAGVDTEVTLLEDASGGSNYQQVATLTHHLVPAETRMVATIPRTLLLDTSGAPASIGHSVERFWAVSVDTFGEAYNAGGAAGAVPSQQDHAPDSGVSPTTYAVQYGVRNTGSALLSSTHPFRASNGEAATFRFSVVAVNLADQVDTFDLQAANVPANWGVRFNASNVQIEAHGQLTLDVFADVPFIHTHGTFRTFAVELVSHRDAGSVGRVLLGILYVDPPQPAGHHNTLHLHTHRGFSPSPVVDAALGNAEGAIDGFMNTLEKDNGDVGADLPPDFNGFADPETSITYTWSIPLSPALALGLDFDLNATGEIDVPISGPLPIQQGVVDGALYVVGANLNATDLDNAEPVATLAASPAKDVASQTLEVFTSTVKGTAKGDYIPHAPNQQLWLRVRLTMQRPDVTTGGTTPVIKPGGTIRLPLLEYRDAVQQVAPPSNGTAGAGALGDSAGPAHRTPALSPVGVLLSLAAFAAVRRRRA